MNSSKSNNFKAYEVREFYSSFFCHNFTKIARMASSSKIESNT
eukprot:UN02739